MFLTQHQHLWPKQQDQKVAPEGFNHTDHWRGYPLQVATWGGTTRRTIGNQTCKNHQIWEPGSPRWTTFITSWGEVLACGAGRMELYHRVAVYRNTETGGGSRWSKTVQPAEQTYLASRSLRLKADEVEDTTPVVVALANEVLKFEPSLQPSDVDVNRHDLCKIMLQLPAGRDPII